jgi:hypothetical protein
VRLLLDLEERFWKQVQISDGCWEWTGSRRNRFGYGCFNVAGGKVLAHRMAWKIRNGAIPNRLCVLHRCDNPPCVNPDHLFLGTRGDNAHDMEAKERSRHPTGLANGRHTKPERTARGERHGFRLHPEAHSRGERSANAKLTERAVKSIRQLYKRGASAVAIAHEFDVSRSQVFKIVQRKAWAHVA